MRPATQLAQKAWQDAPIPLLFLRRRVYTFSLDPLEKKDLLETFLPALATRAGVTRQQSGHRAVRHPYRRPLHGELATH